MAKRCWKAIGNSLRKEYRCHNHGLSFYRFSLRPLLRYRCDLRTTKPRYCFLTLLSVRPAIRVCFTLIRLRE